MILRSMMYTGLLMCVAIFMAACAAPEDDPMEDVSAPQAEVTTDIPDGLPTMSHPATEGEEWQPLFEADLSNAVLESPDSWVVEDGVLQAMDHSVIWTEGEYSNFVLDVELMIPENTNSGIFFRTADTEDVLSALEMQIFDEVGDKHSLGAIYDLKAPSGGEIKPPGEWNHVTLTAYENMVYVVLNGEQVIEMNLNNWTEAGMNPDGTENKFGDRAITDQAESGPIGLQGIHGENETSVLFRNLMIRPLGDDASV